MERCIILAARRYDFKDDSGRRVEGVTLNYLTGDPDREPDRRGLSPLTIGAPVEVWHQLQQLPGVYAITFRQRPGQRGRPTLQATAVEYVAPVALDGVAP